MRVFENKFTVEKKGGSKCEIAIGELYIISRKYNFIDADNFESIDVLVAMPISISESYITFYTICIDWEQGMHVSGRDGNNLILSQKYEDHKGAHIVVDPPALEQILKQVPARNSYIAIIDGYEVETLVTTIQCRRSNFASMNITPIGIKLTDLRHWPKAAITWWARYHLQLSEEQLQALSHFDQRWKMIAYAREVFTYHCADFNFDANKKMKKKMKLTKTEEAARMVEQCTNYPVNDRRYNEECYIIDKGNPGFLNRIGGSDRLEHYFKDPESGHTYCITLNKKVGPIAGQMNVTLSVNFKACEVSVDRKGLRDEDFCVMLIDGYVLHIRKDSVRDLGERGISEGYQGKPNINRQTINKRPDNLPFPPWHKPEDPVTNEGLDQRGKNPDYYIHDEIEVPEITKEEYEAERELSKKAKQRYALYNKQYANEIEQLAERERQLEERSKEFAKMATKVKKNKDVHEVIEELLHKNDAHEMNKDAEINVKAYDFPQIEEDEGA